LTDPLMGKNPAPECGLLFGGHIRILRLQLVQQDGVSVYEELPEPPFGAGVVHCCCPSVLVLMGVQLFVLKDRRDDVLVDLRRKCCGKTEMSLISVDTGATLGELPTLLKQWMSLQEKITELNGEIKGKRAQSRALKEVILRIMESNRVAALNVSKGTVLHKVRETAEAITDPFLYKHCKDFFGGDEDRAKALVEYLNTHRGTKVSHDLRLQVPKDDDRLSHRS